MRVVLASTFVPFVDGGAGFIVDWLQQMLVRRGHEVETLRIPFDSHYPELLDQMLAVRLLDVSSHGDRLIAIRTPSYLLRHPAKVLWFIHHHRGAYDLWGTPYQDIPDTPGGRRLREAIVSADNLAFGESRAVFTNSGVVRDRLRRFNGVNAEVLYPPLMNPERYRAAAYGDYVLYVSRLTVHKRQHLAIEAMRHTRSGVRLIVAGAPENEEYLARLRRLVETLGLRDRVEIRGGWIPEQEKIDLFSQCLAAIYVPFDEDSYGYPSLEAHHSGKAVITTSDAGGTLELVRDGENGFVAEPSAKSIAAALDRLYRDRTLSRRMGEAGAVRIEELGISWDRVVTRLLA
jgi:glycosyltransferase involved in cell wall biosynthesis